MPGQKAFFLLKFLNNNDSQKLVLKQKHNLISMYSLKIKLQLILSFTALFIGLSILALMNTANAGDTGTRSASISHTPSDRSISAVTSTEYISPTLTTQFPFNGVGLEWNGPTTNGVELAIQVDDNPWVNLEMQGNDAKNGVENNITAPYFISGETVRYKITGSAFNTVQNVTVHYFDSTIPPYRSLMNTLSRSVASTITGTSVVSRADWGADESYRTWEPDYETPTKIVIHHSAGGDGGEDPAATIRGIYYWHAVVLGWGDIGYNFIIDPAGTVYEGRYGGAGVIGAHAYNSDTETNYNVGSVGIVLLGCYEEAEGACSSVDTMTPEMQTALEQLTAEQASQFGFDPAGESTWYDELLPNVLGHRDIDATYCPGSSVHDTLDTIRTNASTYYRTLSSVQRAYAATFGSSDLANSYAITDVPTINVTYTNVGRKTWQSGKVALQVGVDGVSRQRFELASDVESGNTANYQGTVTLPDQPGDYSITTRLYRNGHPVHGSKHTFAISISNPYAVRLISSSLPTAILQGWTPTLSYTVRNTGAVSLPAGTTLLVNNEVIANTSRDWPIGEKRTLTLPVTTAVNWERGNQRVVIKLRVDDNNVQGSRNVQTVRVD